MKKILEISAACFAICLAAACAKEVATNDKPVAQYEPMTLSANIGEKTVLEETSVLWNEGDQLSVFSTTFEGNNNCFSTEISGTAASADFEGQIESGTTDFVALYPYDATATCSEGMIETAIPTTQTATAGSFANGASLTLASGTRTPGQTTPVVLTFSNLCAVMTFTLPGNITFADRIVVASKDDTPMAGAVTVDCEAVEIVSATSSDITLEGAFAGGNTYCFTVAPGTYASGFRFTVSTRGGNTYVRETSQSVSAQAGVITNLGTLSLALDDATITDHSVTITHNYGTNTLTGSTAKLNISFDVPDEFGGIVSGWKVDNVKLSRNGTDFRTLGETALVSGGDNELDVVSGKPYIPQGDYTYTADVKYTVNNGVKDIERTIGISGTATSEKPDVTLFSLEADLAGYTSYSCYTGTDGQAQSIADANNCDNSTIYGIGATYKSGLSQDVYDQCPELFTFSTTLDEIAAEGDAAGQLWTAHTIGCGSISFDGAETACSLEKTVYVTGLPYNAGKSKLPTMIDDWVLSNDAESSSKVQDGMFYIYPNSYALGRSTVTFDNGFYAPAGISANVSFTWKQYSVPGVLNTFTFSAGTADAFVNEKSNAGWTNNNRTTESTIETTFTSEKNSMVFEDFGRNYIGWTGGQMAIKGIWVLYR